MCTADACTMVCMGLSLYDTMSLFLLNLRCVCIVDFSINFAEFSVTFLVTCSSVRVELLHILCNKHRVYCLITLHEVCVLRKRVVSCNKFWATFDIAFVCFSLCLECN